MSHILEDLKAFLDASPTSWHTCMQIGNRLALQDFTPLNEGEKWDLQPGCGYFVVRGGSLCAFHLPKETPKKAIILGSHTDSPALKLKPLPVFSKANMVQLGIEIYGSPLINSWLNRDLGIAGRVVITDQAQNIEEKLVFIDDAPLVIPQLAIHLDKEVNEKGLLLNKQEHLCPVASLENSGPLQRDYLETLLRKYLSFHTLLSFDLYLIPLEKSRFLGGMSELIASYRLDNLAGVYASLTAFGTLQKPLEDTLPMVLFWDHEEIGSRTAEGAASSLFLDILLRIGYCLKLSEEERILLKNRSFCLSVDMAHALNPNFANKHDPHHQPLLGHGIVFKYNADQKYATSASSAARLLFLCQKFHLPYQSFASRNDLSCGSTIGPVFSHTTGISTVDIGCPQLSMHSAREVMACQDYVDMCRLLTHALQEL